MGATADFPKKYLHYVAKSVDGDVSKSTGDLENALKARTGSISQTGIFLPNMSLMSGTANKIIVNSESASSLTVYKINVPGFLYYHHWKGIWNPKGSIRVLVCKAKNFSSNPVFELMNSKDTTGTTTNDHVNNMFPIRPGKSTYIAVLGSLEDYQGASRTLFFVPAWNSSGTFVSEGTSKAPSTINPSSSANCSDFRACFEL